MIPRSMGNGQPNQTPIVWIDSFEAKLNELKKLLLNAAATSELQVLRSELNNQISRLTGEIERHMRGVRVLADMTVNAGLAEVLETKHHQLNSKCETLDASITQSSSIIKKSTEEHARILVMVSTLNHVLAELKSNETAAIPFERIDFTLLSQAMLWPADLAVEWELVHAAQAIQQQSILISIVLATFRFVTWSESDKKILSDEITKRLKILLDDEEQARIKIQQLQHEAASLNQDYQEHNQASVQCLRMSRLFAGFTDLHAAATMIHATTLLRDKCSILIDTVNLATFIKVNANTAQRFTSLDDTMQAHIAKAGAAITVDPEAAATISGMIKSLCASREVLKARYEQLSHAAKAVSSCEVLLASKLENFNQFFKFIRRIPDLRFVWNLKGDYAEQFKRYAEVQSSVEEYNRDSLRILKEAEKAAAEVDGQIQDIQRQIRTDDAACLLGLQDKLYTLKAHVLTLRSAYDENSKKMHEALKVIERARSDHEARIKHTKLLSEFILKLDTYAAIDDLLGDFNPLSTNMECNAESFSIYLKALTKIHALSSAGVKFGHIHLAKLVAAFEGFIAAYTTKIKADESSHKQTLSVLEILVAMNIRLTDGALQDLAKLLDLRRSGNKAADAVLLCARSGMNVGQMTLDLAAAIPLSADKLKDVDTLLGVCELCGVQDEKTAASPGSKAVPFKAFRLLGDAKTAIIKMQRMKDVQAAIAVIKKCTQMGEIIPAFNSIKSSMPNDFHTLEIYNAIFQKIRDLYKAGKYTRHTDDIGPVISAFNVFLGAYKPLPTDMSAQHRLVVYILNYLNDIQLDFNKTIKERLASLLVFNHIGHATNQVFNDFLVCACAGVNIRDSVPVFVNTVLSKITTPKSDLVQLLYACYIHDANAEPDERIPADIIDKIFGSIQQIYGQEMSKSGSRHNAHGAVFNKMLFTSSNQRYDGGALKESHDVRVILQAASFYKHKLDDKLGKYLDLLLSMNDNSTISPDQQRLFEILKAKFSDCPDIEIGIEKRLFGCFGADILLTNRKTGKQIDVELDGVTFHYYISPRFTVIQPLKLMREDSARDMAMYNNQVRVERFTPRDFAGDILSGRLDGFIREMRAIAGPPATPVPVAAPAPVLAGSGTVHMVRILKKPAAATASSGMVSGTVVLPSAIETPEMKTPAPATVSTTVPITPVSDTPRAASSSGRKDEKHVHHAASGHGGSGSRTHKSHSGYYKTHRSHKPHTPDDKGGAEVRIHLQASREL